ncbi:MAG: hypothetical protein O3B72_00965, partial [Proteobacteria bacterium]|nr:hypothetical protein [Pseudomonadota bacterium]
MDSGEPGPVAQPDAAKVTMPGTGLDQAGHCHEGTISRMAQSFISSTLTPAWLGARLGEPVNSLEVEPINQQGGYLADLYRVHYSTRGGEHTLVLKTEAADPARRNTAERYQSYWKESLFYRQVAGAASISVPHCYF